MRIVFSIGIFIMIVCVTEAQTTRGSTPVVPEAQYQNVKKEKRFLWGWFDRNKTEVKTAKEEHEAFRERIAQNLKKKAREQKKADKPQYTDPLYFGHKKPPKKRKNGKKKFCKECGLTH